MYGQDWHSHTVNNLKTFVLQGSYEQLKHVVHSLRIPASTRSLKSSKVGADMTGRPFQRHAVDGKKDPLQELMGKSISRNR